MRHVRGARPQRARSIQQEKGARGERGGALRGRLPAAPGRGSGSPRTAVPAGADGKWTPINGSKDVFTRKNGRAYRLSPTKNKRWELFRIADVEDTGARIGAYGTRGDVNRALAKLAYEPEPRR